MIEPCHAHALSQIHAHVVSRLRCGSRACCSSRLCRSSRACCASRLYRSSRACCASRLCRSSRDNDNSTHRSLSWFVRVPLGWFALILIHISLSRADRQAHSRLKIVWVHPGIEQDKFGYGCMKLFCKFVQRVSFLYTITDSILTIHIFFHKNIFRLFYEILRVWLPNWNHLIIPLLIEFDNRSCGCINFIAVLIASSFKFNLINRHAIIPIQFSLHLKSIGTCNTGMG